MLKEEVVKSITETDRKHFYENIKDPHYSGGLDITPDAARYLAIPSQLMEAVKNPQDVISKVLTPNPNSLLMSVYYWNHWPIIENTQPVKSYREESLNRYQILQVGMYLSTNVRGDKILRVSAYSDNEKYRGRGVATGFYTRLRECAEAVNFWAIMGLNNYGNIGFYTRKLGRIPVDKIKAKYMHLLLKDFPSVTDLSDTTVDLLNPSDKAEMIDPEDIRPEDKIKEYWALRLRRLHESSFNSPNQ